MFDQPQALGVVFRSEETCLGEGEMNLWVYAIIWSRTISNQVYGGGAGFVLFETGSLS